MSERTGRSVVAESVCPFCELPVRYSTGVAVSVQCECCGNYKLDAIAETIIKDWLYPIENWAATSYEIRRIAERHGPPLSKETVKYLLEHAKLPKPHEALDAVVVWLAEHSPWPGKSFVVEYPKFRAIFGAVDKQSYNYYVQWLRATGFIDGVSTDTLSGNSMIDVRLTPFGWERYRELTTTGQYSRHAFMAMQFGDAQLTTVFESHFAPATLAAGYELRRTTDQQEAGLIDDHMRLRIRTSRFVVCDLTHQNRGAYWEAGFAEGLSKPVIYTCRADVFNHADPLKRPHFDTNHLSTVLWEPSDLPAAARSLKAMIRSTLPSEAKLED